MDVLYDERSVIGVAEEPEVGYEILQKQTSTHLATSKHTPEPHQMAFVTAVSPISAHHRSNHARFPHHIDIFNPHAIAFHTHAGDWFAWYYVRLDMDLAESA